MSNTYEFTKLAPVQLEDVEEVVTFYNLEIDAIQKDPRRMTMWSPFTNEQAADIVENPHSDLLIRRDKLGSVATGVIVDKDFSAWSPQEIYPPNPRHLTKGLGRGALWPALLEYGRANNISMYVAEAWDFTYDGLPEDKLRNYYISLGMKWRGTVVYKNSYYDDTIIGNERPVNRFLYEFPELTNS